VALQTPLFAAVFFATSFTPGKQSLSMCACKFLTGGFLLQYVLTGGSIITGGSIKLLH